MATPVRSYAKVNLGLRIGPVRPDGFHALATVYQTVDMWDRVTVSAEPARRTAIQIHCEHRWVPRDHRNTAWQAVERALRTLGVSAHVAIEIDKQLAVQGGMGAGSANAAAALLCLERELSRFGIRPLTEKERLSIAVSVGSDVPLFLHGGASLGTNRGEVITPLADGPEHFCVIAQPEVPVSTPQAFRAWDDLQAVQSLTADAGEDKLEQLGRDVAEAWRGRGPSGVFSQGEGLAWDPVLALVRTGIENDFEKVVFPQHPLLRDLKRALLGDTPGIPPQEQALTAMLSGSGSALFGLYTSDAAQQSAAERVRALDVRAVCTKTVSRERYLREMWL